MSRTAQARLLHCGDIRYHLIGTKIQELDVFLSLLIENVKWSAIQFIVIT